MKHSFRAWAVAAALVFPVYAEAQAPDHIADALAAKPPRDYELVGTLTSDYSIPTGQIRSLAITVGKGGSGPYKSILVGQPDLSTHTIYRPADLAPFGQKAKLPIIAWANGGCANSSAQYRNFLSEIASHGFLVVAVGPLQNTLIQGAAAPRAESKLLISGIDWVIAENRRPDSPYYQKIDTAKIAMAGQSCGGVQALQESADSRIVTTAIWGSGIPSAPRSTTGPEPATPRTPLPGMPSDPLAVLSKLHGPVAFFYGGELAIEEAANEDFGLIDQVPVVVGRYQFPDRKLGAWDPAGWGLGHYPASFWEPDAGVFGVAGVAWFKWQLKGDNSAAALFSGSPSGLEKMDAKWSLKKKKID